MDRNAQEAATRAFKEGYAHRVANGRFIDHLKVKGDTNSRFWQAGYSKAGKDITAHEAAEWEASRPQREANAALHRSMMTKVYDESIRLAALAKRQLSFDDIIRIQMNSQIGIVTRF